MKIIISLRITEIQADLRGAFILHAWPEDQGQFKRREKRLNVLLEG